MLGNMWEWVEDAYIKDAYTKDIRIDPILQNKKPFVSFVVVVFKTIDIRASMLPEKTTHLCEQGHRFSLICNKNHFV